ncbi:MAG TPA: hypothetical protein DDZ51_20030 [Planctomycetaceae bacterium]|nr:hypothetical protein [Planctomycetaceae bacterium]
MRLIGWMMFKCNKESKAARWAPRDIVNTITEPTETARKAQCLAGRCRCWKNNDKPNQCKRFPRRSTPVVCQLQAIIKLAKTD